MKRKSKGQIPSQMFTYILTLIIIGLMLYLGVGWIGDLMSQQRNIVEVRLKTGLENEFSALETSYNKMEVHEFEVPNDVERVCFMDQNFATQTNVDNQGICSEGDPDYNPVICDIWKNDPEQNVAFYPQLSSPIGVSNIDVEEEVAGNNNYYMCTDISEGRFSVRLIGKGDSVEVTGLE